MKCLVIGLMCLVLLGCATTGNQIDLGKWDKQNAAVTRQYAKDLLETWRLNSGFLRGAIGDETIKRLPCDCVSAWLQLDILASAPIEQLTDYQLGYSLGLRVKMLTQLVLEGIRQYAPQAMKYVPGILGL